MLEPTGEEETGTGQLVDLVQVAEPWLAAAVAVNSSVRLSFLIVLSCFPRPYPNHCAAAADIGTGGVGLLLV